MRKLEHHDRAEASEDELGDVDRRAEREVRTFQTTTADLLRLSEWLAVNGCTHVAMEATGIYWKPVWHILDDGEFELVLANAAHVKNVPGGGSAQCHPT
jgi:transposase